MKCIYCQKKETSKEHAFPQSLLHKCVPLGKSAPEWIIEQVCKGCNGSLGELDELLATKSSMALIWRRIKNEWEPNKTGKRSKSLASVFYNVGAYGVDPVRLLYPDPLYRNLIVLHEEAGASAPGFHLTPVVCAQAPQMILTQYAEGQTGDKIRAEIARNGMLMNYLLRNLTNIKKYTVFLETPTFFLQRWLGISLRTLIENKSLSPGF